MKNVKIVYRSNTEWQEEIALAINNQIVISDNLFTDYLEGCDITINEYKTWSIYEKIKEIIAGIMDGYFYNSIDEMNEIFEDSYSRNIEDFVIIDEKDTQEDELINYVKGFSNKTNCKYIDTVIDKLKLR